LGFCLQGYVVHAPICQSVYFFITCTYTHTHTHTLTHSLRFRSGGGSAVFAKQLAEARALQQQRKVEEAGQQQQGDKGDSRAEPARIQGASVDGHSKQGASCLDVHMSGCLLAVSNGKPWPRFLSMC